MITIEKIFEMSKPHGKDGGRHTVISNGKYLISIVGGRQGLYGDFQNDFEVAIINPKTKTFVTKYFFPENNDDVMPYVPTDKLIEIVNMLFPEKSFQES